MLGNTITDGILTCGNRIVVPGNLRPDILSKIHAGHTSLSRGRAREPASQGAQGAVRGLQEVPGDISP